MLTIYKRELSAYFKSLTGFVYLAVFYALSGLAMLLFLVYYQAVASQPYSYSSLPDFSMVFQYLFFILVLLVPILTMRLMSEDKRQKTDQALLTAPIRLFSLVAGKFLAAYTIFVLGMASTFLQALVVSSFSSDFDWLSTSGNFVAILLLGGAVIAMGLFLSSLTESQVIAAVVTYAAVLVCILLDAVAAFCPEWLATILNAISLQKYFNQFTLGTFQLTGVLFYLSFMGVFLFLTVKVLEKRRWS
ncbi:MAG: ABC transporter permease subunit [Oscillospiraceae bacterium]|nr:ABC transporter permease subunit [Oscillospiraceae bacterium]